MAEDISARDIMTDDEQMKMVARLQRSKLVLETQREKEERESRTRQIKERAFIAGIRQSLTIV